VRRAFVVTGAGFALAALLAGPAAAQQGGAAAYAQRYAAVCAACHGANGRSDMPHTPALAGQHSFYAITQLFLFREGRRSNEAMTAIAKTLNDADLRGFCHGADLSGGQQVPRLAQQREDYLQLTLQEYKSGKRPGYTMAMGEALGPVATEDLDTLAYFMARFQPPAPAKK
jgi:cytochrome c553